MNSKRFLCIGAHPDDMEICCGGTAVQLVQVYEWLAWERKESFDHTK